MIIGRCRLLQINFFLHQRFIASQSKSFEMKWLAKAPFAHKLKIFYKITIVKYYIMKSAIFYYSNAHTFDANWDNLRLKERRKIHEWFKLWRELRKLYVNVDATNIMVYKIKIHDELNVRLLSHWHCSLYAKKQSFLFFGRCQLEIFTTLKNQIVNDIYESHI